MFVRQRGGVENGLIKNKTNISAVLWLGGRSCLGVFWSHTLQSGTACRAVVERKVYDLAGFL